jgi:hypothetical protein
LKVYLCVSLSVSCRRINQKKVINPICEPVLRV